MATKNDATGDTIQSKTNSDAYRSNYDRIFNKTQDEKEEKQKREEIARITLDDLTR